MPSWWARYSAYLRSPEWADRRARVLARDGRRCQAALPGCFGEASEAHHLTYRHMGNEPLFELVAVCYACHRLITGMDRSKG